MGKTNYEISNGKIATGCALLGVGTIISISGIYILASTANGWHHDTWSDIVAGQSCIQQMIKESK